MGVPTGGLLAGKNVMDEEIVFLEKMMVYMKD